MSSKSQWHSASDPPIFSDEYHICIAYRYGIKDYWNWLCTIAYYSVEDGCWYSDAAFSDEEERIEEDYTRRIMAWKEIRTEVPPEYILEEIQNMNRAVVI